MMIEEGKDVQKLNDEELDQVVGGTTAETAEVSNYLKTHCGWDGKGSIRDALQKALGYDDGHGKSLTVKRYDTSDTGDNLVTIDERRPGSWDCGGTHQYLMTLLKQKYGW